MNKRQMCPSLSCHYPMSLLCPNVCLVWVGQTLNMLFLVKSCSFFQKCDKKVAELLFFSSYCVLCTIFLGMSPQKACWTYLGTKSTFKAAQKLTPSQFCSENVLNKAIFPKNANFGIRCILFIMFFARDSDIILMVYNGQIKMQCWHHFKFSYVSLWLSNLAQ